MPAVKRPDPDRMSRRERAKATRWRIAKAAYTLFCQKGFEGTTMADVAEEAGVAVQTVYFTFSTKRALLSRAIDFAVMGEDQPRIPQQQAWYTAAVAEPDIDAALRLVVVGCGEIIRRVAPIHHIARASGEAEVVETMAFHEEWRADGYGEMLGVLRTKAPLRPGLSDERATHLLLLYIGEDVYHFLVELYDWTHDAWVDWTVATVAEQLFVRH